MGEVTRQRRRKRAHRAAGTPGGRSAVMGMVDCWACSAPNGPHREGCFNCGSLLSAVAGPGGTDLARVVVGGDGRPGRVVYVRL